MAAEYSANALQTVEPDQDLIFTASNFPCTQGLIFWREDTGNFLLSSNAPGTRRCNCGCSGCREIYESVYRVGFNGNIAVSEEGEAEEIQIAIAVAGTAQPQSIMRITPAAVSEFQSVSAEIFVGIPNICGCQSVSVRNISDQAIDVQNANITFDYIGIRRVV